MDRRSIRLDSKKLDYLRLKKGWSQTMFGQKLEAIHDIRHKVTARNILNEGEVYVETGRLVAELLGAENLLSILHPDILKELTPPSALDNPLDFFTNVGEWEALQSIESPQVAPNGLVYDTWKMRHRHISGRLARGKCYSLNKLSSKQRTTLKGYLTRHSEVCDRIGSHPNIVQNRDAIPWEHGEMWWIIDEWIDGERLDSIFKSRRLESNAVPPLMRNIAEALHRLHAAGVIRRELTPRHIWIRSSDQSPVLTDFELSKLLDGAPTVAPPQGWLDDGYRAIEVAPEATLAPCADVYSWGRIAVEALCRELPSQGQEATALAKVQVPPAVRQIILSSVALPASERPADMAVVLNAIKKWK